MSFCDDDLNDFYDKTAGRCHVCRKKLAFTKYGLVRARGAWEVDHSRARARGGTDLFRNLLPACIGCNRSKGARSTRSARAYHGYSKAPLSRGARSEDRSRNTILAACAGAIIGHAGWGPKAAPLGLLVGALIGSNVSVDG